MSRDATGWTDSAAAWIAHIDRGDWAREVLIDQILLDWLGDCEGNHILDLGCGEGRFLRMLQPLGAKTLGIDPTVALLAEAQKRSSGPLCRGSGEELPFRDESFDFVVSVISLIDIPDYRRAIAEAARVLKPGGRFLVANIAAFASALMKGWVRDDEGKRLYYPIDHYLEERMVRAEWAGISVENWHRPLSAYMSAFIEAGLVLEDFVEPAPSQEQIDANPDWEFDRRVPYVNVMRWRKPRCDGD